MALHARRRRASRQAVQPGNRQGTRPRRLRCETDDPDGCSTIQTDNDVDEFRFPTLSGSTLNSHARTSPADRRQQFKGPVGRATP